jgi:hypothetical protein
VTSTISVSQLSKHYKVPEREGGLKAAVLAYLIVNIAPSKRWMAFRSIERGEVVGFLGPNGAGKPPLSSAKRTCIQPQVSECVGFEPPNALTTICVRWLCDGNRNQLSGICPPLTLLNSKGDLQHPVSEFKQTRDDFIDLLN